MSVKKLMQKLFGGIDLTWPKLILFAIIAGVLTAVIAIIPALLYTSFHAITATFEVWILFGILIILNSKSNLDSALKCFVFFLISQPLVYLIQVPFSWQGWGLFQYYRYWFIWTVLCLPMGYIGYYMKQDKWWGYLILLPLRDHPLSRADLPKQEDSGSGSGRRHGDRNCLDGDRSAESPRLQHGDYGQ